ncbi:hypothetical protein Ae201684_000781 [Aphanomyces euteiches]|uniref:Retrotransposon gag domain-containing protein n=1 Tax=Aphanomyces euteiches TaxID=100861 RepID=A0A6G0XUF3_9STRA|nr:hypothetical protein Ae201684_000781 [Aphanomyces euteiches]
MEDSPRHATSERQVNEGSNLPTSPAWYPKEGEGLESASLAHPSSRGGSRRLSHGSGTPSKTATTPHSVVTMAMLEANNEQLIRQLMTMMKNTTQRAPELDDWIDDDPTPVGILQENPNTIRLMPVETIPVFDGNRDDRDAAATWLSRFEETAFSCGWSDVETLRRFKLHTAKPVQDWVSQLDPSFKASWPNLRARFRREYVRSRVSKEAVYYNMRQRPGEHVKDYFVRLNAAAINIRLDYRRSRSILDDHIDRFANSLLDTALGTVIRQQQFVSIDNLESYLERQLANGTTAKVQTDTSITKQTTNTIPISDRVKAKKNNVQFMDEDLGSSRMSPPYNSLHYASSSYLSPDQYQAEIYALGRNNSMAKRIHCGECGREHYSIDGQCWSNVFCTLCNKMGHPENNCFKACAICTPPHNKYERCEKRERVAELKEFLEAHAIEGMPSLDCLKF